MSDSLPIIGDKTNALKQINTLSEQFEKNNVAKETPEQISEHVGSILRSCNIREILADKTISREEIKEFKALKLTEYEMKYLATGGSYLLKLHPEQFQAMIQKETGMKDANEIVDLVNIEFPDGRKKSLRHIMIETSQAYETIKKDTMAALPKKSKVPSVKTSSTEIKLDPVIANTKQKKSPEPLIQSTEKQLTELVKKSGKDFFEHAEVILNGMSSKEKLAFVNFLVHPIGTLAGVVVARAADEYKKLSLIEKMKLPPVVIQMYRDVDNKII